MIGMQVETQQSPPQVDQKMLDTEAKNLSDELSQEYARQVRLVLVSKKKLATGETYRNVRAELVLDSASRGTFFRRVVGSRSLFYITMGRKAGAKLPIRKVGTNTRGKPRFEPLPSMLLWFAALGIPFKAWWPILLKMKRRGIRPLNVQKLALDLALPRFAVKVRLAAAVITQKLVKAETYRVLK